MMLTEKGSTRGTVSVLLISALIFMTARVAVNLIEENFPPPQAKEIEWQPVPDVLKTNEDALDEEIGDEPEKPAEPLSDSRNDATGGSTPNTDKKIPRKRFAVERLFPDNVDQKPLLILFADKGSVLSKRMEHVTLAIPSIREKVENEFYPIKINFDKPLTKTEFRIFKNFGSAASPIVSIRSSTGDQLAYSTGYLDAVKTIVLLNNALAAQKKMLEGGKK